MPSINRVSTYIPSGAELEKAARAAIENIDRQLKKMPPMKKPASAADNFPWIYNDPSAFKVHILGQREPIHVKLRPIMTEKAINVYKNAG